MGVRFVSLCPVLTASGYFQPNSLIAIINQLCRQEIILTSI
jgi:hypothetical protein